MASNKWRLPESLFLLSLALLGAYLAGLPLPLPAFVVPERRYLLVPRDAGLEGLRSAAAGSKQAWAVLAESTQRLPDSAAPDSAWERVAAALPERPVLEPLEAALRSDKFPVFARVRIVAEFAPTAAECSRLENLSRTLGLPMELEVLPGGSEPGVESWSWRTGAIGEAFAFELLFTEEAANPAANLEIRAERVGQGAASSGAPLWRGSGADLPRDRVLRLSTNRENLSAVTVSMSWPQGARHLRLAVPVESSTAPKVLVIDEGNRGNSFIDSLYPARHVTPRELGAIDPADWELVVDDGVPISGLQGDFATRLADDARKGRTSLLFAADSAAFGKRGDNPTLEEILPVTLLPPSLKDLPDMAILILLDYSGSMFGGKLSLAKVTSLEILHGLKPTDRVGLLLFSDKRRWIWSFVPNRSIEAAPILDPVEAEGGTEMGPALLEGIDRLASTGPGDKHIVVISDGVSRPADFPAIAAKAKERGITISTMGVGDDMDRPLLERLASDGGGTFRLVKSADEIPALIFEDRRDQARPRFSEGRIPVLDPAGARVAVIGGMAQYAPKAGASVLYANDVGDPLLAERDSGRRAVMLFASDLHGGFTRDFFAKPSVVATLRDRLDSLFTERPRDIAILETAREDRVVFSGGSLVAPSLEVSDAGKSPIDFPFVRRDGETWQASVVLPSPGLWRASLMDRGTSLASFGLPADSGLVGTDAASVAAAAGFSGAAFRLIPGNRVWLALFFLVALSSTLAMRRRR